MTLIEALCLVNSGWTTEEEHTLHLQARKIIWGEARRLHLQNLINKSEQELAKMEKPNA